MNWWTLGFLEIDKTKFNLVGGKGANLGELSRIEGIRVPAGFCVTTEAFKKIVEGNSAIDGLLDALSLLNVKDHKQIGEISREIRRIIEEIPVPDEIREEVHDHISGLGEKNAFAVRSSATAEDLPSASFAGQQESYLNVIGKESILKHISKCWASLFTERAISYRIQNAFDHRKVSQAVVVQKMIFPSVSGILFTADPVTSNRKVLSIDAGFGLGEALVSGLVSADNYKVKEGEIIDKKISAKKRATYSLKGGGTIFQEIEADKQNEQALTDKQILELTRLGRKIEEHFTCPQDIEWCLAEDRFYFVQSRPITTLYPIPLSKDQGNHVYLSVSHQQMMTDPMKPLGISFWQLTAARPMFEAGGRLFVDISAQLTSPSVRKSLLDMMEQHDPLMKDAIMTILERGEFIHTTMSEEEEPAAGNNKIEIQSPGSRTITAGEELEHNPDIITSLINRNQISTEELKNNIRLKSGTELLDFILKDIGQLKKILFDPQSTAVFMAAIDASSWINEKMQEWLGEKNAADTLSQSVPYNITSEMGLALLDVADAIRPHPEVIEYLQEINNDPFLTGLIRLRRGKECLDAINAFLHKYGMRCAGEIDITKTRWSEKPAALVPLILNNNRNFQQGEGKRKFEQGFREAREKEHELLERLLQLPDGEQKASETKRMIGIVRNFIGYREYPKFGMVNRYFVYKQALLKEAEELAKTGVIQEKEDIFYLAFEELQEVIRRKILDYDIIGKRKEDFKFFEKLTPPRVITSDGEIITGAYKRGNLPSNAMTGLAVSSGVTEGRARVILNMEEAYLEEGDILITAFTDPSWTPLFLSIKGLVTEVGGLMTHGAVIAREYGIPAVVGVENATRIIKDWEKIRINGTDGYVEKI